MAKVCSNTLGRVRVSATVRSDLSEVWASKRTVPSGENANFHMGVSRQLTRLQSGSDYIAVVSLESGQMAAYTLHKTRLAQS